MLEVIKTKGRCDKSGCGSAGMRSLSWMKMKYNSWENEKLRNFKSASIPYKNWWCTWNFRGTSSLSVSRPMRKSRKTIAQMAMNTAKSLTIARTFKKHMNEVFHLQRGVQKTQDIGLLKYISGSSQICKCYIQVRLKRLKKNSNVKYSTCLPRMVTYFMVQEI